MNMQVIIQKLIDDQLINAASMYAYENSPEKIHMLIACATGEVVTYNQTIGIVHELTINKSLYL